MIAKALDPVTSSDKKRQAGHRAEAQLAFYLKRAFEQYERIHVLNGVRLEAGDDAVQLDHLTVHPYGMVVIESKSVYAMVKINDQGEWLRLYNGHYQGMPSAKLQADRQVSFLRRYLEAHAGQLLDARKRASFEAIPIDVLVAISDSAVIVRPKGVALDYLCKAEQVPERIMQLLNDRQPKGGFLGLFKDGFSFTEGELGSVTSFLRSRHTPLEAERPLDDEPFPPVHSVTAAAVSSAAPAPTNVHACKHCQGERLEVRWGRYSYYFKCLDCDQNTAITRVCEGCGEKERVRKDGSRFFAECATCNRSSLLCVNP